MSEEQSLVFELAVNNYRSRLAFLNANLFIQILFNLVAFRVVFGNDEFIDFPVLGIRLSVSALSIVIPIGLATLWLQFGFQLNSVIQTRASGLEFIQECFGDNENVRGISRQLFRDYLISDGWFFLYRPDHNLSLSKLPTLFLMLTTTVHDKTIRG